MIARRTIRFDHDALAGVELPCFEAVGTGTGPHLSLLGGIHGGEYSSIAAVVRFMNDLDTGVLEGRITAVPVVNVTSFRARSAFVTPEDGKNLNRCFPGSLDGTFSDVLARCVFDQLIAPSDVLLDLHGGDVFEALEPFTLYDESPVADRARELAVAFGLPYVISLRAEDAPVSGTTTSAAAAAGIPAVIAEAGGRGVLEEEAVRLHLDGLANALRALRMLPGEPAPPQRDMHKVSRFVWLRSQAEGWWEPAVGVGDRVAAGEPLGTLRDLYGEALERTTAPEDGVVLFLTSSPAVAAEGVLLGLGAGLDRV
jgi:predicted deacylase